MMVRTGRSRFEKTKSKGGYVSIFIILASITYGAVCYLGFYYPFKSQCAGYLGRAANATNISIASTEMEKALKYIEDNDLKSGSTAIFFEYPKHDIEYWYNNLKSTYDELNNVDISKITNLESSNMLLKLREVVLNEEGGVTYPPYVYFYPYHVVMIVFLWVLGFVGVASVLILVEKD